MILTRASAGFEGDIDGMEMLRAIELAGRTCYKSEDKITDESAKDFVATIMRGGHESVIEHGVLRARVICDRGVTHELVRHRLAAYSQESTRYCNYKGGVEFIIPPWVGIEPGDYAQDNPDWTLVTSESSDFEWFQACMNAEKSYLDLIEKGWKPQQARSVLPNSLKTEIVVTANLREWRRIFDLRAVGVSGKPHPQMVEVMMPLLKDAQGLVPIIFDDIVAKLS